LLTAGAQFIVTSTIDVSPWAAAEAPIHDPDPSAPMRATPLVRLAGFDPTTSNPK